MDCGNQRPFGHAIIMPGESTLCNRNIPDI